VSGTKLRTRIKEVVDVLIHVEDDVGKRHSLVFTAAADTGDGRRHIDVGAVKENIGSDIHLIYTQCGKVTAPLLAK
jgi:hypothetical protein